MAEQPQEAPEYLTPKQAGELIGIGRTAVYKLIEQGKIPTYRVFGRARRLKRSEVLAYAEGTRE